MTFCVLPEEKSLTAVELPNIVAPEDAPNGEELCSSNRPWAQQFMLSTEKFLTDGRERVALHLLAEHRLWSTER